MGEVPALLTYDRDRQLFERFRMAVTRRSAETRPIYVVRHANAGKRERWSGPDEARRLTRRGGRQADALVAQLAGLPLSRLLSSPYVRCVHTLEPLAESRGLPIETSDSLAEGAALTAVLTLLREVAPRGETALCTVPRRPAAPRACQALRAEARSRHRVWSEPDMFDRRRRSLRGGPPSDD